VSRRTAVWVVLAIALVVAGAAVSFTQRDRIDREAASASTTAEAEPTVVAISDCPWGEASCILGQGIERALRRGNVEAVMEFGAEGLHVCPGPQPQGAGGPFPLCDGAAPQEGRYGYRVGRRHSETRVVKAEEVRALVQSFVGAIRPNARDEVGSGQLTLYGFSCTTRAVRFQHVSCAREGIILSAIVDRGSGPQREVLIFWAMGGFQGRTLPFTEVWDGLVLDNEAPTLFRSGGFLPDLGDIHVIDQSAR
jgi:hypothetical protein